MGSGEGIAGGDPRPRAGMLAPMRRVVRDGSGGLLVLAALGVLFYGVVELRAHDYVSAIILVVTGLCVLGAGVELLRPSVGE